MAPPTVTYIKASEVTKLIRHEFSGDPNELQAFMDDCKLAHSICPDNFKRNVYIEIMAHITKSARSDLRGREDKVARGINGTADCRGENWTPK